GTVGAGDEPFAAVDRPATGHAVGGRRQHRRIRARARSRLGHGETRADVAGGQRREITLALGRRGDHPEQVHVALIGSGAIERLRSGDAVARALEDTRHSTRAQAESAELYRDLWGEDARTARSLL